ncbi:hypothetical protein LTR08_006268 [Meristemomyces frigidus]|nr:hypothetical protein LTR08_006268 [Meristemomyces frigidus]
MSQQVVRRLRPCLFHGFKRIHGVRQLAQLSCVLQQEKRGREATHDLEKRVAQLEAQKGLENCWPRLPGGLLAERKSIAVVKSQSEKLDAGETDTGSKLLFIDISNGDATIQALCQLSNTATSPPEFKSATKTIRKGDWYALTGHPHKTTRGEPSILATRVPQLLAPSLHQIPDALDDPETLAHSRHVNMLVNPSTLHPLLIRHHVLTSLRSSLAKRSFIEVSTPILTAGAGGAVARPFETEATELEGQTVNLRIAPELWLKRLVVGGMERVFEIGPVFRNEGVDATHNPEFTICESYQAFATLDDLMETTQRMLLEMEERVDEVRDGRVLVGLPAMNITFRGRFPRLEFIPALEKEIGLPLPNLSCATATDDLLALFKDKDLAMPSKPTLPRLLDALAGHYLEPLCQTPTFITHHPAALSPLSKHSTCPTTGQTVAARAELFIKGREYANMYEEQNSPFVQRQLFEQQLAYRTVDGEGDANERGGQVDEAFLEALEWGLPPTGGWGCGVDRLVMLFSGRERLGDVLSFGGLRNVVGAGGRRR